MPRGYISTRTINLKVTQQDIDMGQQSKCRTCPVALALSREFINSSIQVCELGIIVEKGTTEWYSKPPHDVVKFIRDFDLDGPQAVEPFESEITFERVYL